MTSTAGTVNEGTETFTILNGTTVIGTAVTVNVVNGAAGASYTLPAGTAIGSYTIQAVYNGDANFLGYTDASHTLTINHGSATTTTAANASTTFSAAAQTVALSATVTSTAGTVNEGTETFTILNGTTVDRHGGHRQRRQRHRRRQLHVAGRHRRRYLHHPGRLQRRRPTSSAITDASHVLTINAAATATAAANASATFNAAAQTVALSATVTSGAGTVNEGTETFTILNGTTVVGTPVTVNVVGGAAGASYTLPAGAAVGSYTIRAVYNGDADFLASTDTSHVLTVSAATTTAAANASAVFSTGAQTVALSATVTSPGGTVNEGTETFTLLNGTTVIGTPITVNVVSGAASANYALPAGVTGGSYTIQAVYNGDGRLPRQHRRQPHPDG